MNSPAVSEAVKTFKEGLSCSQAILLAFGARYGLNEDTAIKISRSFGGGMARTCQTCGAATGAYMVLGLSCDGDDPKSVKEKNYALVNEFARRFKELHGDVNCQNLLGCNLGTSEGQEYFKNNNLVYRCRDFVRDAAIILEDLIEA